MASRFCRNGAASRTIIGKCRSLPAFVQVAGALAADGRLHHGVDVARRQAVARRAHAIDVDADGRLAERTQHGQIGDAGHLGQHRRRCCSAVFSSVVQVVAVDLDRILALHAGGGLLDVVLDVLREIEVDAGELLRQRVGHVLGQLFLVDRRRARHRSGFSGTKNSALKKPVASVPSSGRPCCETTDCTSG